MIMEPAKSNVINLGGLCITPEYLAMRERQFEWFGF